MMSTFTGFYKNLFGLCLKHILGLYLITFFPSAYLMLSLGLNQGAPPIFIKIVASLFDLGEMLILVVIVGFHFNHRDKPKNAIPPLFLFFKKHVVDLVKVGFICLAQVIAGLTLFILPGLYRFFQLFSVPFAIMDESHQDSPMKVSISIVKGKVMALIALVFILFFGLIYVIPMGLSYWISPKEFPLVFFGVFKALNSFFWVSFFILAQFIYLTRRNHASQPHKSLA